MNALYIRTPVTGAKIQLAATTAHVTKASLSSMEQCVKVGVVQGCIFQNSILYWKYNFIFSKILRWYYTLTWASLRAFLQKKHWLLEHTDVIYKEVLSQWYWWYYKVHSWGLITYLMISRAVLSGLAFPVPRSTHTNVITTLHQCTRCACNSYSASLALMWIIHHHWQWWKIHRVIHCMHLM